MTTRINPMPAFPRLPNSDGTFKSICPGCFQAVARSAKIEELNGIEDLHACRGFSLAQIYHGDQPS